MFDVLDSVESALTQGSSSLGSVSAASRRIPRDHARGAEASELARLQRVLSELEHRVFGGGGASPRPCSSPRSSSVLAEPWTATDSITAASAAAPRCADGTAPWVSGDAGAPPWPTGGAGAPCAAACAAAAAVAAPAVPADVTPSTPPRRSREFDFGGLWADAPSGSPVAPRRAARAVGVAEAAPRLEEIDDVVALLRKVPPEAAPATAVRAR